MKKNASIFVLAAACFFLAANALAEGVVTPVPSKNSGEAADVLLFNSMTMVRDEMVKMRTELDACVDFVNASGGQSIPGGYTIQPGQCPGVDKSVAELRKQQAALNDRKANKGHVHSKLSKGQREEVALMITEALNMLKLPPQQASEGLGDVQAKLDSELASLRLQIQGLSEEQDRLKAAQEEQKARLDTVDAELKAAQAELKSTLEGRIEKNTKDIAALKTELQQKLEEQNKKMETLANRLNNSNGQQPTSSAEVSGLKSEVEKLVVDVRNLKKDVASIQRREVETGQRLDKVETTKMDTGRGSVGANIFAMENFVSGGLAGEYEIRLHQGLVIVGFGGLLGSKFDEAELVYGGRAKLAFTVWRGLQLGAAGFAITGGFDPKDDYGAGVGGVARYDWSVGDGVTIFTDILLGYAYRMQKVPSDTPEPLPGVTQIVPDEEWDASNSVGFSGTFGVGF